MKLQNRILGLIAFSALGLSPAFGGEKGEKIVHRWVDTNKPLPPLRKVLVVGIAENGEVSADFEDEMKKQLAKVGIEAVPSPLFVPPRNEMMEPELKRRIKEVTLDAVLIVRPKIVSPDPKKTNNGFKYTPPSSYSTFWPYWNMAYMGTDPAQTYLKANSTVRAEFNLYNTKDGKLMWSGESGDELEKKFEKLGKNYAQTITRLLKKDKVIGNK
jgi:hypothetical protein